MVNVSTKQKILNLLKSSPSRISGEEMSACLGISRVAVWKQIKSLTQQGYRIDSGPKGYILASDEDCLTPLEFREDEEILFYNELGSTMDEAVRQIHIQDSGSRSSTVLADHQIAGQTRDSGTWESPSGGVYLTFMLREEMALTLAPALKSSGILSVLKALRNLGIPLEDLSYRIGGDILIKGSKVGGILEEYRARGSRILWFALGIGIHLNDSPAPPLSSVSSYLSSELSRIDLIRDLKKFWDQGLTEPGISPAVQDELKTFRMEAD